MENQSSELVQLPALGIVPSSDFRDELEKELEKALETVFDSSDDVSSKASTITVAEDKTSCELPPLPHYGFLGQSINRFILWFQYDWFSLYRKVFALIFLTNMVGVVYHLWALFIQNDTKKLAIGPSHLPSQRPLNAAAVNLTFAILFRNEHVVNCLFTVATSVPLQWPLFIRRISAKVYQYGGVHSSCAASATIWYLAFAITVTVEFRWGQQKSVLVALAWVVVALFLVILVFACPKIRTRYHNTFESVHRFIGWTVMGLFWAQTVAGIVFVGRATHSSTATTLVNTPAFWFLVVSTVLIVYPWLFLRRRKVDVEPLSPHAIRLHFDSLRFGPWKFESFGLCSGIRLTDSPLRETHGFATFPKDGKPGFEVIISKAGDWTAKMIKNPPRYLYTRGIPVKGVLGIGKLFSPVVIVCTGSGIGPCLSFLRGKPDHDFHLLWSTRDPERTYTTPIVEEIYQRDPQAMILDTTNRGRRPDMVLETYKAYLKFKAQAIIVISNPTVTKKIVYEMEARGIPAFGPIWDS